MIVRAIDLDGDWLFGKSKSDYLSQNAAVSRDIKTRILCFIGDCFFDLGAGINWFLYLGSKGPNNEIALNLAIKRVILNTPGVTGILQLSIQLNSLTRVFSVSYQVQTTYSVTGTSFQYNLGAS